MAQIQDPLKRKDFKVTSKWDLVISQTNEKTDLSLLGTLSPFEVMEQVVRLALSTKKGAFVKDGSFGSSPQGRKTYMTPASLEGLKAYIVENLRNSNINPYNYPMEVKVLPVTMELIAIQVAMIVTSASGSDIVTVNSLFNESTQELLSVRAFGG